jgi:hypothetical protein
MGIDALLAIGGLIVPPLFDIIKKKIIPASNDTPERTAGTLATTDPNALPGYIDAIGKMLHARKEYFNRDVVGSPSQWVVDLRAGIRPTGVILAMIILGTLGVISLTAAAPELDASQTATGVRYACVTIISSWFGDRLTLHN